jgi:hypothetical protein
MGKETAATVDDRLLKAWQKTLPDIVEPGSGVSVRKDDGDPHALRVTVEAAGRTGYSFDFKCTYLDEREVRVELIDAEKDGRHLDERNEHVQNLIEWQVRHIHECAQALAVLTNR